MTDEGSEWQRIGEIPIDTMRLVLVDPMSLTDVADHEVPEAMTYELVTNDHGVAVAMVLMNGSGRRALSRRGSVRGRGRWRPHR
jgi:hypothetical protein